jgi:hypothetical protein
MGIPELVYGFDCWAENKVQNKLELIVHGCPVGLSFIFMELSLLSEVLKKGLVKTSQM